MPDLLISSLPAWVVFVPLVLWVITLLAVFKARQQASRAQASLSQRLSELEANHREQGKELALSDTQLDMARDQLSERETQLAALNDRVATLRETNARLETERDQQRQHHAAQLRQLETAREQLKQEFSALAGRIFEDRQQAFSAQSRESLESLLKPFREQVGQFQRRVEELHGEEVRERSSLKTQLEHLAGLNRQMTEEAAGLARALKGDRKMQGNWGELMLETVLERSGLRRDIEYRREVSIQGEEGRQRPDAVIYLPDDKHLIVDAKVSLSAWVSYVNAEQEAERAVALKSHIHALRNHIDGLASRDYARLPGLKSPDFVFLFVPIEPAFATALEQDPELFQAAFSRHVIVVTPTTLLASLRTVASLWSLERQNDNARLIAERAERLLAKFRGFIDSLEDVGRHLERAQGSYQQAMGRLSSGQGSLVAQAVALERLGVRMKRPLPSHLTAGHVDEDDTDADGDADRDANENAASDEAADVTGQQGSGDLDQSR
ncbi:DNA recombination protein RmuC [Litchfieldella xinjiangensis]|uniref:DNA recombination protein RmuC n=1 Tax=Litchfieldella xinjiangensis TaxID=1166948 RepID=UPI000693F017|nr:DNA recombination protein RmuC [Halomonas xinjiangensis]